MNNGLELQRLLRERARALLTAELTLEAAASALFGSDNPEIIASVDSALLGYNRMVEELGGETLRRSMNVIAVVEKNALSMLRNVAAMSDSWTLGLVDAHYAARNLGAAISRLENP